MPILKKLIFAPLFLIIFGLLIFQLNSYFSSYDFIFSMSLETLKQFIIFSSLTLLSSLTFTLFASFAYDGRFIVPVVILASLMPLLFVPTSLAIILLIGILLSSYLVYLTLENTLKTYLTFDPSSLFGPSIRNLSFLLIVCFSIAYYLSVNPVIQKSGFQIPESLLNSALNFIPRSQIPAKSETPQPQNQIPKEQLELLKKNPELLKQYGLDPGILDTLDQPQNSSTSTSSVTDQFLKKTLKDQLDKFLKPFVSYIPIFLGFLFFITLQSITSFLNLFIYPLLWIIFYLLEKSGFIKFTIEMRPVRKMIV